jgi:FixJ family two-component response regulator
VSAGAPVSSMVFIVDDDPDVLRALARVLRQAGFTVETFTSAAEFLKRPLGDHPSCLVLDLKLPDVSGLQLQEAMAQANIYIPIVFVSGRGDVASTASAMRYGAVDFLEKPVDDIVLIEAVSRAITQDAARRQQRSQQVDARQRLGRLTRREVEVCRLVARGLLNKQIADELGVSNQTVKIHRSRLMRKLEVGSVAELVRLMSSLER